MGIAVALSNISVSLSDFASVLSYLTTIVTAVVLIVKPLREKVLGIKRTNEGMKCLLRTEMLRTYYHNRSRRQIRQYE